MILHSIEYPEVRCLMATEEAVSTEPPDLYPIFVFVGWYNHNVSGEVAVHAIFEIILPVWERHILFIMGGSNLLG